MAASYTPLLRVDSPRARDARISVQPLESAHAALGAAASAKQLNGTGNGTSATALPLEVDDPSLDVVRLVSKQFYATEDSRKASIYVMRSGNLESHCSVNFETEDLSAFAGDKYKASSGTLDFAPGEPMRTIEVELYDDDNFDTTLEFKVVLTDPVTCRFPECGKGVECTVLIIDNDMFPANCLEKEIHQGDFETMQKISNKLLIEYVKFVYWRVPTIWWKSIVCLILGQLQNVYYLMVINLRVYLVDVVFNRHDMEKTDKLLFVEGQRFMTLVVIACLFVLPNFLLTAIDYMEMGPLDMGYAIRKHHRVNLFRKYLNYSRDSQEQVPVQELSSAMMNDIPDLAKKAFLVINDLLKGGGKIICVGWFMIQKGGPKSAIPLIVYPTAMFIFIHCRKTLQIRLMNAASEGQNECQGLLLKAAANFSTLTDYKMRSTAVSAFQKVLDGQRQENLNLKKFTWVNELLVPWITLFAIGSYMIVGGAEVLEGKSEGGITLGAYLATINVYKDLGDRFEGLYSNLRTAIEAVDPLISLTGLLNKSCDVGDRYERFQKRMNGLLDVLKKTAVRYSVFRSAGKPLPNMNLFDEQAFLFNDLKIGAIKSLSHVSSQVPQGSMVLVTGPHGCGKMSLVDLLTDNLIPESGELHVSPHLNCLRVGYTPEVITYLNLWENLTFGTINPEPHRVRRIFTRLGLKGEKDHLLRMLDIESAEAFDPHRLPSTRRKSITVTLPPDPEELLKTHIADNGKAVAPVIGRAWHACLSYSEKKRVHLVRALVHNPDVLVLHKPVDETDGPLMEKILQLLREFVDLRGVELDAFPEAVARRPPRTVFFTCGDHPHVNHAASVADLQWTLSEKDGLTVTDAGLQTSRSRPTRNSRRFCFS